MKQAEKFDIFISYRRKGGDTTARLFYERLTAMGYRVSYDVETLRSGKFNTQLYQRIEACKDVVVIMSADSLELREKVEDDWFRLEIAHAIRHGKNIVPIFLRDFKMPESGELPEDIADLPKYQGVTSSDEHFDSVLAKLCRLLVSRRVSRLKTIAVAVAAAVLCVSAVTAVWAFRTNVFAYPFTRHDRQVVQSVVANVANQCMVYNTMLGLSYELINSAERCITVEDDASFHDAVSVMKNGRRNINLSHVKPSDRLLTDLLDSKIEQAELNGLFMALQVERDEMARLPVELQSIVSEQCVMQKERRLKKLELMRKALRLEADLFAVYVMALFRQVDESALEEFKRDVVHLLTNLPLLSEKWIHEEAELKSRADRLVNMLEEVVLNLATLVGAESAELDKGMDGFITQLEVRGADSEQAKRMAENLAKMSNLKTEHAVILANIDARKENARDKFAPRMDDDSGILWGKALRFMVLKMPDEARKCLEVLRYKNVPDFPPAALDTAEHIFCSGAELPFTDGLLVCMFEPPATRHAIYEIGDVITAVDGKPCRKFEDYRAKAGRVYTIYRRQADGTFQKFVSKMPENQPRVALVNLTEEL